MQIDPASVSVSFVPSDGSQPLALLVNGEPEKIDEARAKQIVSADEVTILIDLGGGDSSATYWTCDLSHVSLAYG
jgi:glutamate N-acetyltransferase / amino-acid N-acetyltransferase